MAKKLSFDAYLGWVNITNPNQIPADARVIGANDLLRYEKLGKDTAEKFAEVDTTLDGLKSDTVISDLISDAESETRYAVGNMVKTAVTDGVAKFQKVIDEVPTKVTKQVTDVIAADGTVAAAAGTAARNAVGAALSDAKVVTGRVESTAPLGAEDYQGGFIGQNGRPTDLVVDKQGKVPQEILQEWQERSGVALTSGLSSVAAGGLVGENGRETDLIIDKNGKIVDHVLQDWAIRLRPILNLADWVPPTAPKASPHLGLGRNLRTRDRDGVARRQTSRSDQFVAWGDSLTDGWPKPPFASSQSDAWPGILAPLLGAPVYNGGISGQSADEIAMRTGGLVPYLLPEGGKIPASGSVVVTTPDQVFGWRLDRGFNDTGTLAGVPGRISRSSAVITFTRTTAGSEVAVGDAQPWVSAGTQYSDATAILMLGRNDIGYASTGTQIVDRIVAANVAIVESLTPHHPRFLILGTTNSTGEYRDSANWKAVTQANDIVWDLYPDSKLDIRSFLVNETIYDQKITPTADDLARMGKDALPPSIMVPGDGVHYSQGTAASIARRIYKELKLKGWAA